MPYNRAEYTKEDMRDLKRISDNIQSQDLSFLPQVADYLTSYINKYKNSKEQSKLNKVAAARRLLPVVKSPNGILSKLKNEMTEDSKKINSYLEKADNDPNMNIYVSDATEDGLLKGFRSMESYSPDRLPDAQKALTVFMEEDDFAEYKTDSPLRKLEGVMQSYVDLGNEHQHIIADYERREIMDSGVTDMMKQAWEENSRLNVAPLHAAYGSDLNPENARKESLKADKEVSSLRDEIFKLEREYEQNIVDMENAEEILKSCNDKLPRVEKELDEEQISVNVGASREQTAEELKRHGNAFAAVGRFYDELQKVKKEDPTRIIDYRKEAADAEAKRVSAEARLKKLMDESDPDRMIDGLVNNVDVGKETARQILKDHYNNVLTHRREENKWLEVKELVNQCTDILKDDERALNYLLNDDSLMKAGYNRLEREYKNSPDPQKQQLFDIVRHNVSRISELTPGEKLFTYDGKTDQLDFIKELNRKLDEKAENARKEMNNDPIMSAYIGYKESDNQIRSYSEMIKKAALENNAQQIGELTARMNELTEKRMEYGSVLQRYGINNEEMLEEVSQFAEKNIKRDNEEIREAKDQLFEAEKEAKKTAKVAKDLTAATEYFKNSKMDMLNKDMKDLVENIASENPDYSKLPDNNKFIEDDYYKTKDGRKLGDSKKLQDLKREYSELTGQKKKAEEILANDKRKQLNHTLTEKRLAYDKALKNAENMRKKTRKIDSMIKKTKEFMKPKYQGLEDTLVMSPKLNTKQAYSRIYDQVSKLREDFNKCMKDDYKKNPEEKNSNEYKAIKTALNSFGETKADFEKLTGQEIYDKLGDLERAANNYTREKKSQTRWFPSPQRKYRLAFSDRVERFAKDEGRILGGTLNRTNEKEMDSFMKYRIAGYRKQDPNGMTMITEKNPDGKKTDVDIYHSIVLEGSSKEEEVEKKIKSMEEKIDKRCSDFAKAFAVSEKKLSNEHIASALIAVDYYKELKDSLRDPDAILKDGVDRHLNNIEKMFNAKEAQKRCTERSNDMLEWDKYINMAAKMDKSEIAFKDMDTILAHRDKCVMQSNVSERARRNIKVQQDEKNLNAPKPSKVQVI